MTAQTAARPSRTKIGASGRVKQEHDQDHPGEAVGNDVEDTIHSGNSSWPNEIIERFVKTREIRWRSGIGSHSPPVLNR